MIVSGDRIQILVLYCSIHGSLNPGDLLNQFQSIESDVLNVRRKGTSRARRGERIDSKQERKENESSTPQKNLDKTDTNQVALPVFVVRKSAGAGDRTLIHWAVSDIKSRSHVPLQPESTSGSSPMRSLSLKHL